MRNLIAAAQGKVPCDLVLKNGKYVNVFSGEICTGDVAVSGGYVVGMGEDYEGTTVVDLNGAVVLPGYIDGHMHVESTQLTPGELAKMVVPRGTTTLIADPHEIANVCGMKGIEFLAKNAESLPMDVKFMLPSCVPATPFEDSGAILDGDVVEQNIDNDYIHGLGEFMNYPGVTGGDGDVWKKLDAARTRGKVIDGHAPNTYGKMLNSYLLGGISTDHECVSAEEAADKVSRGMYVHLREGSATRNVKQNMKAVNASNMRRFILATDDRHASDLRNIGHIDNNLRILVENGMDPVWAVTMATLNTAECYGLKGKGAIAPGYIADLVVVKDLTSFEAKYVFKDGKLVAENGKPLFETKTIITDGVLNTMHVAPVSQKDFALDVKSGKAKVIRLLPANVVTERVDREVTCKDGNVVLEGTDLLKLAVIERHKATGKIGLGLIEGYGLTGGAIGLTVAHDSHNLIVLGDNDRDMALVVSELTRIGGGMAVVKDGKVTGSLPLEIAGLITAVDVDTFETRLAELIAAAYEMGVKRDLQPFMSLSFLSLVVIPELKMTCRGLFDVGTFSFTGIDAE